MYTITMKRGPKADLVRTRSNWGDAWECAYSLAELHGLKSPDIEEDTLKKSFTLDASKYYERKD